MTTIVADRRNGILAADTQATFGTGIKMESTKIWVEGNVAIATCGSLDDGIILKSYLFDLFKGEDVTPPSLAGDETDGSTALIMNFNKKPTIWMANTIRFVVSEITDPFIALGSGSQVALGALSAGATPIQAIKIAHKHDSGTGKKVMYYDGKRIHKA